MTNLDGELIGGIEREVRDRHDHKLHRPEGITTMRDDLALLLHESRVIDSKCERYR